MKSMRRAVLVIVPVLWSWQASGAPLSARTPSAASSATAAAPSGPTRPAPPAHVVAPYKPIELSNPSAGLQQSTVQWKVPDQSGGREIQQWLVRACPKVDGTPYAACQQVLGPAAGQSSGAIVQAQIPAHVMFMGSNTPVNGAEICSVNSAGTSCADRIAVRFVNPGVAPAKLQGAAPSGMPLGTAGIRAAPGAQAALNPQPLPPGGTPQGQPGAAQPGATRGIIVVARPATAPQTPEQVQSATTGGGSASGSLAKKPGLAAVMIQTIHTAQITADGTGIALSSSVIPGLVHTSPITADGTGFALSSSVIPGLVHTSPITADGTGVLISPALKPSLQLKKGS